MKSYQLILFLLISVNLIAQDYQDCRVEDNCHFCMNNVYFHLSTTSDWEASWTKNHATRSANNNQETNIRYQLDNSNNSYPKKLTFAKPEDSYSLERVNAVTLDALDILKFKLFLPTQNTDLKFKVTLLDQNNDTTFLTFSLVRGENDSSQIIVETPDVREIYGYANKYKSLEVELKNKIDNNNNQKRELKFKIKYPQTNIEIGEFILLNRKCIMKKIIFDAVGKKKYDPSISWIVQDIKITSTSNLSESTKKESIQPQNNKSMDWYKSGNTIFAIYVANEEYEKLDTLINPINDAKNLSKVFKDKFGDYYQDTIFSNLNNENFDPERIFSTNFFRRLNESDIILFHYGGHGFTHDNIQYWAPINFRKNISLSISDYYEYIDDKTNPSKKKEIIKSVINKNKNFKDPKQFIDYLYKNLNNKCIVVISDACRDSIELDISLQNQDQNPNPTIYKRGKPITVKSENFESFYHSIPTYEFNGTNNNIFMIKYAVKNGKKADDNYSYTHRITKKLKETEIKNEKNYSLLTFMHLENTPTLSTNTFYNEISKGGSEIFYFIRTKLEDYINQHNNNK